MTFLYGATEYWLVAGSWNGKMIVWSQPGETNHYTISQLSRSGHRADVLGVDFGKRFIVTGGADGVISVWHIFSGALKCTI